MAKNLKLGASVASMMAVIGVGICVRDPRGRLLLGCRTGPIPGEWSMPGGKVDQPGESFETAAGRELREETGIEIPAVQLRVVGFILDHAGGSTFLTGVATAPVGDYEPRLTEPHRFSKWEYFSLTALPRPLFAPTADALELLSGVSLSRGSQHAYLIGSVNPSRWESDQCYDSQ
jgi:8-oxo-dGTP diphosphatase